MAIRKEINYISFAIISGILANVIALFLWKSALMRISIGPVICVVLCGVSHKLTTKWYPLK